MTWGNWSCSNQNLDRNFPLKYSVIGTKFLRNGMVRQTVSHRQGRKQVNSLNDNSCHWLVNSSLGQNGWPSRSLLGFWHSTHTGHFDLDFASLESYFYMLFKRQVYNKCFKIGNGKRDQCVMLGIARGKKLAFKTMSEMMIANKKLHTQSFVSCHR